MDRNHGIHQVVQPHRITNFDFGASKRLVYAEAGNATVKNLVVGRTSCNRTNENSSDSMISEE